MMKSARRSTDTPDFYSNTFTRLKPFRGSVLVQFSRLGTAGWCHSPRDKDTWWVFKMASQTELLVLCLMLSEYRLGKGQTDTGKWEEFRQSQKCLCIVVLGCKLTISRSGVHWKAPTGGIELFWKRFRWIEIFRMKQEIFFTSVTEHQKDNYN
jgi:hypothetical protein